MSQPPTSSPSTKSCGIVGQPERAESTWRMRGSGRMSIAAKSASTSRSDWMTRIEKPHIGRSGVPFMNSMTRFPEIAVSSASAISCSLMI